MPLVDPTLASTRSSCRCAKTRHRPQRHTVIIIFGLFIGLLCLGAATATRRRRWRRWTFAVPSGVSALRLPIGFIAPGLKTDSLSSLLDSVPTLTPHAAAQCTLGSAQRARYTSVTASQGSILVAVNLFGSESVLPTFINELVVLARFVDPRQLHVVIVENGSLDATPELLGLLARVLRRLGVTYSIQSDGRDVPGGFKSGRRIEMLAQRRNALLQPLANRIIRSSHPRFEHVVFVNDVFWCATDVLELVYQRERLNATMTAGLDYEINEDDRLDLYDTWVAKSMHGQCVALDARGR